MSARIAQRASCLCVVLSALSARAAPGAVGVETGVLVRQESASDTSPHPWLGLRAGLDMQRWLRLTATYGLSYGLEGREPSATTLQQRVAFMPEAMLSLGGPRVYLGLGVLADLRAVSFRNQGAVYSNALRFAVGPAATTGLDVDVRQFRVRFGVGAALLNSRLDWSFTVAVERVFSEAHQ